MKTKLFFVITAGMMLLAACAPTAVPEAAPAPVNSEMSTDEQPAPDSEPAPAMADTAEIPAADASMNSEVSFNADIWPVIEKFALTAHGGKGGIFLESYDDIMNYVVPGSPEESMLYKRLTADGVSQMPPSGPLPDETIQLFYDWIAQGAKNN